MARMGERTNDIPHTTIRPLLNDKLFLTALRMLRQRAIDKAVRVRRITAPQYPAGVHPPQAANAHHHRHDLTHFLAFDFHAADLRPRWKHDPRIQSVACGTVHAFSTAQPHRMLISDESIRQGRGVAQRLLYP